MLSRHSVLLLLVTAAAFALTMYVFFPGVMTEDARYVYEDIAKGFLGDWQSPVMTVLWSLIDPVAPGPGSMFLLIAALYWLAFGVLALAIARYSVWFAVALLLLALSPPAFVFVGMIWRDVLLAGAWLLAAALCFACADGRRTLRIPVQLIALGLLAFGFLLRPNALAAAPVLAAFIVWPSRFSWRRAALLYVPAAVALFGLMQVVYYGALKVERQNPLQTIMVFDLGGISHFAGGNEFPGSWTASETAMIAADCYQPTDWGVYWNHGPCTFVMDRLTREKLFGSPAILSAWMRAVARHPGAYLQHRAAFMWTFLAGDNFTIWRDDLNDQTKMVHADRAAFTALVAIHDALKPTPLFRIWPWLLFSLAACVFAWPRRDTPPGAFVLGVCGSASVYVLTFFVVGVAPEFRYGYWAVLASIAGGTTALLRFSGARESSERSRLLSSASA